MRKLALCVAVLFVAALAMAQAAQTKPAVMTHEVKTEVVSFDVAAKTLTIKDEKGADKTVPVKGAALEELKTLKAGDQVILTCQDNDKGEHEGVIKIKKA